MVLTDSLSNFQSWDNVWIKAGWKTEGKWSTCTSQNAPSCIFLGWVTFGWIQQLWKGFFIPSCNTLLLSLWLLVIRETVVFPCGETLRISLVETFKTGAHSGGITSTTSCSSLFTAALCLPSPDCAISSPNPSYWEPISDLQSTAR